MATSKMQQFMALQGAVHSAVEPFEAAVSAVVLNRIAAAAVAQWAYSQDESVPAERIVEFMREGMRYVNTRFPA